MRAIRSRWLGFLALAALASAVCLAATSTARADEPAPPTADDSDLAPRAPETIELNEYLVLPAVGHYGRLPLHQDAIESLLATGRWKNPNAGDVVELSDSDKKTWRAASAEHGTLETRTLRGGYAFTKFDSPVQCVMLLQATGDAAVYVNGELRAGDPYRLGWLKLPVLVRRGDNTLLFHLASDDLSARLTRPPGDVFLMDDDRTLPTLVRGETDAANGAVPIVNATTKRLDGLQLECQLGTTGISVATPVPSIGARSIHKAAFQIPAPSDDAGDRVEYSLRLTDRTHTKTLAETRFKLDRVGPDDIQIRTFRSRIDGSIQPYAVRQATRPVPAPTATVGADANPDALPGMIISLHDSGVTCDDQARQYTAKEWAHIVAPTGRRPFGFDWEDWGRLDALEALADAHRHYPSSPRRTYLTGYAMGGHGTWHLGVTYPDLWAALGVSGGWASFWSYGGGMPTAQQNPSPIDALELRGYLPSDTVQLLPNLSETSLYVLHGAADEQVPVVQARFMRTRLAGLHNNFEYYEKPDAGHAWGKDCCDWPPMMEFLKRQTRPNFADSRTIDFTTADPGISARCDWLTIEAQQETRSLSRVNIHMDTDTRSFEGQTTNVARLAIDVRHLPPGQPLDVTLDLQHIDWIPWPEEHQKLWLERSDNQWKVVEAPSPKRKGPDRYSSFKSAFDHNVMLVYGTGGTEEEDRWAEMKARYDAETFWYRGGGAIEVVPDTAFDLFGTAGRSVILYGNADTNSAWPKLLSECPVSVGRGQIRVGDRTEAGNNLAVLLVYPRAGSDTATVGAVGGTGPIGMALTNRLRYFVSGIPYPDVMLLDTSAAKPDGRSAIRAWGYFGPDWSLSASEIAWRDAP